MGRLVQPRHYARIHHTAAMGIAWAADNDAYGGFDTDSERRFYRMLDDLAGQEGCLFVTAPDVVGESGLTGLQYEEHAAAIMAAGLPAAYVAQDAGVEYDPLTPPWGALDALFIGGTDQFKLGPDAAYLAAEAKRRGKWVHMGRVNTVRRIAYAASIGCDSVDGTGWVRYRDTHLATGLAACAQGPQLRLAA